MNLPVRILFGVTLLALVTTMLGLMLVAAGTLFFSAVPEVYRHFAAHGLDGLSQPGRYVPGLGFSLLAAVLCPAVGYLLVAKVAYPAWVGSAPEDETAEASAEAPRIGEVPDDLPEGATPVRATAVPVGNAPERAFVPDLSSDVSPLPALPPMMDDVETSSPSHRNPGAPRGDARNGGPEDPTVPRFENALVIEPAMTFYDPFDGRSAS